VLFGGDTWKPISGHIGGSNELHDEDWILISCATIWKSRFIQDGIFRFHYCKNHLHKTQPNGWVAFSALERNGAAADVCVKVLSCCINKSTWSWVFALYHDGNLAWQTFKQHLALKYLNKKHLKQRKKRKKKSFQFS
jgi:hypothetical protein